MMGFLVAGSASGVGKTTVTLAILAALRKRGLVVQAMKGGPDFLDTTHHTRVSGRPARNLDTWMMSAEANRACARRASAGADALVVEGMMGLFDGKDGASETGSSAEIAKLLGLPVILILDGSKSARSLAATLLGFELFDPHLQLAGVVLNRLANDRHFALLRDAITSRCRTPILGWMPRAAEISIPERHLGLHTADESFPDAVALASMAERHLEIDAILDLKWECEQAPAAQPSMLATKSRVRIGVARDRAFSFYYEDNLDLLREHGGDIVEFSPLNDSTLPGNLDALYLGGGYPELYAAQLGANLSMLASIRGFAQAGRPVYAECGGMIYLGTSFTTGDGENHPMANVLPLHFEMTDRLVSFGYVTVTVTKDCHIAPAGTSLRGHSFHYSRISKRDNLDNAFGLEYSLSGGRENEGFLFQGVLASYVHLHFGSHPEVAERFVNSIREASLILG
ncbi:cobyrinate a,c-diamide synthase [Silvibacterium acidisoli]|uniref:cobyrinate a,c-diamide synthase n=1 Tax=Acidobacteriaceae bacterium ZG23-2 TaxID=2883246 RepID=UPI00406C5EC5